MKEILIVTGHTYKESAYFVLTESYKKVADNNDDQYQLVQLVEMKSQQLQVIILYKK